MMKGTHFGFYVAFFMLLLVSCGKKKREALEGVYAGTEQYIHIGPYGDTTKDESRLLSVTLDFQKNGYFLLTKETYPESYEIPSSKLVKENAAIVSEGLVPRHIWSIEIKGDSLIGSFKENNGWSGSYDHYYFKGVK